MRYWKYTGFNSINNERVVDVFAAERFELVVIHAVQRGINVSEIESIDYSTYKTLKSKLDRLSRLYSIKQSIEPPIEIQTEPRREVNYPRNATVYWITAIIIIIVIGTLLT